MSGIIGGAGSKSGVIGETELDYEEGTWTPTNNGGTVTINSPVGVYTKIGNIVHIFTTMTLSSDGDGTQMAIGGLPFAAASSPAYFRCSIQSNAYTGKSFGLLGSTLTYISFYKDNIVDLDENEVDNGAVRFGITYRV